MEPTYRNRLKAPLIGSFLIFVLFGTSFAGTTVFPGGSLDDLKALSPTLTFDVLVISGGLTLPAGGSR